MAGAQRVNVWSRGGWGDGQELGEAIEGVEQRDIDHLCILGTLTNLNVGHSCP